MKAFLIFLSLTLFSAAQIRKGTSTFMKNDAEVIHVEDLTDDTLTFDVFNDTPIYYTRRGNNKLSGALQGQKAELICFDSRAFQVRVKAHGKNIVGWVSPYALSCSDPNFVENFKKVHQRQVSVNALISAKGIGVGMTAAEVEASLGKPTKTSFRRTTNGTSGTYEYTEKEEKKHYNYLYDNFGRPYKVFSHSTEEIKSQTIVEFTNDTVSAIQEDVNNEDRARSTVFGPIYSNFNRFTLF